jgi:Coenzyme PQQ synthesis protein D (PqqD)
MWNADSSIVVTRHQVSCDIGGETAILSLTSGVYYGLDSIGSRVWDLIQEPKTVAELETILAEEYDVEADRLASDLRELCDKLAGARLIEQP